MRAYTRRVILVVTEADQNAANQQAANLDSDVGGNNTFSIPISPTGNDPATHYACNGLVRPTTLTAIESIQQVSFPTGKIYRANYEFDDEEGVTRWSYDQVLSDMGLQRIEPAL